MAESSLPEVIHPLDTMNADSALAIVLETEDTAVMPLPRFEAVIRMAEPGSALQAYLVGLYDQRRISIYSGCK